MDSYQISALTKADLALFLTRRYIDEKTRAKLEKLIDLRTSISQVESKLEGFNDEVEQISDDQKRLRENIEALSKTAEAKTLITRYIEKVNQQESRLEEIEKERRNLAIEKQSKEAELLNEIRTFSID
jgi:chromosome segregation ATPase